MTSRVIWPTGRSDLGPQVIVVRAGESVQAAVDGASAQYRSDGIPRAILIAPGYYAEDVLVRCNEIHLSAIGGSGTVYLKSLTFSDATLESLEEFNSSADATVLVADDDLDPPWSNTICGIYCMRSYNVPRWGGDAIASLRVLGSVDRQICGDLRLEDVLAYKALERMPPWPPWPPRPPRPKPLFLPGPLGTPPGPSPELIEEMKNYDLELDPLRFPPWPPPQPVYRNAAILIRAAEPEFVHSTFYRHVLAWNCVTVILRDCQIEDNGDLVSLFDPAYGLPGDTSNNGANAVDCRFSRLVTRGTDGRFGGLFFERCTIQSISLEATGAPASEMLTCSVLGEINFQTVGPTLTFYGGEYYNEPTGDGVAGWTRVPSL